MADRRDRYERRQRSRERRQQDSRRARLRHLRRRLIMAGGALAVVIVAVGGLALFMTTRSTFGKELPPTGFTPAHLESRHHSRLTADPYRGSYEST